MNIFSPSAVLAGVFVAFGLGAVVPSTSEAQQIALGPGGISISFGGAHRGHVPHHAPHVVPHVAPHVLPHHGHSAGFRGPGFVRHGHHRVIALATELERQAARVQHESASLAAGSRQRAFRHLDRDVREIRHLASEIRRSASRGHGSARMANLVREAHARLHATAGHLESLRIQTGGRVFCSHQRAFVDGVTAWQLRNMAQGVNRMIDTVHLLEDELDCRGARRLRHLRF